MRFAILLPVYNNLEYTKATLEGLSHHLDGIVEDLFHIVLIDDGSTDGTSDWVRQNYPEVILLSGDGNLWWSGAVNIGASHSMNSLHADYIILWNNDIDIDDEYFPTLQKIVAETEESVVIGSKIYVAGQQNQVWSAGGYFNPRSGKNGMYGYFEEDNDILCRVRDVDWLTGMGTIIPTVVIDRIGLWDSQRFPQYYGDSDFTYRAKLAGSKLRVYPDLKLYNHVANSGIEHRGDLKSLVKLFTDIRSKSNLKKKFLFTKLYAKSPRAYLPLIFFYMKVVGGFVKWKILNLMGIRKQTI